MRETLWNVPIMVDIEINNFSITGTIIVDDSLLSTRLKLNGKHET
jgi:hypothetical protein